MLCQLDNKFLDVEILSLLVEACRHAETPPSPAGGLVSCLNELVLDTVSMQFVIAWDSCWGE